MDDQLAEIRAGIALMDEDRKQRLLEDLDRLIAEQNGAA